VYAGGLHPTKIKYFSAATPFEKHTYKNKATISNFLPDILVIRATTSIETDDSEIHS
jgi:hypothetical protein